MEKNYESYIKLVRISKKTGKEYAQWNFTGYHPLPDLETTEHFYRGAFLHTVEHSNDIRYRIKEEEA